MYLQLMENDRTTFFGFIQVIRTTYRHKSSTNLLTQEAMQEVMGPMYLLQLQATDVHAALGRLLDQARVAGLKLAAVSAEMAAGADESEYTIRASLDVTDREIVDRLARRIASIVGVGAIEVSGECADGVTP